MRRSGMQLEDYFEFIPAPEQIRVKGTRIGIEHVIRLYQDHMAPEQIAAFFCCPLTVEEVYATITYYLHNKDKIDDYLKRLNAEGERLYQEYLKKPPSEIMRRLCA